MTSRSNIELWPTCEPWQTNSLQQAYRSVPENVKWKLTYVYSSLLYVLLCVAHTARLSRSPLGYHDSQHSLRIAAPHSVWCGCGSQEQACRQMRDCDVSVIRRDVSEVSGKIEKTWWQIDSSDCSDSILKARLYKWELYRHIISERRKSSRRRYQGARQKKGSREGNRQSENSD